MGPITVPWGTPESQKPCWSPGITRRFGLWHRWCSPSHELLLTTGWQDVECSPDGDPWCYTDPINRTEALLWSCNQRYCLFVYLLNQSLSVVMLCILKTSMKLLGNYATNLFINFWDQSTQIVWCIQYPKMWSTQKLTKKQNKKTHTLHTTTTTPPLPHTPTPPPPTTPKYEKLKICKHVNFNP